MASNWININLIKFYSRQKDEVLHRCMESHSFQIWEAIRNKDEKNRELYRKHKRAVKYVLESRFWG